MQSMRAVAVKVSWNFRTRTDITNVQLDWGKLAITLISGEDKKVALVNFSEIVGFRFLDEGDLLEFWPGCAAANGWLFLVEENGWFDLEASRSGFLQDKDNGLSEYFLASQNGCVSVLTTKAPMVEIYSI